MARKKEPKSKDLPIRGKVPVGSPGQRTNFVWSFQILDYGHPKWCFSRADTGKIAEILKKLGEIEHLTFAELGQSKSHFISVNDLVDEAKNRLSEIYQDDIDEVYSIRFQSVPRVFAIYQNGIMKVIWWDPLHEICPSRNIQDRSRGKRRS